MKNIRVGIPRALLYYRYADAWKTFIEELGYEVITSPETTAGILKDGIKKRVGDLCLPVKTFLGHVESLKDSVDFLFIPRYISVEHDAYMCPKILGLPDVVRACFTNLPRIIDPMFNIKKDKDNTITEFSRQVARILSLEPEAVEKSFIKNSGAGYMNEQEEYSLTDKKINVGLIGRPYLLFDRYLGKNLFRTLSELGANPVYIQPSENEITEAMTVIPKWVYWSMGKEVTASAHAFFKDDKIDGIINICSATCGPDSFTGDLIRKRLNTRNKPYMTLSVDEHASDTGIQTRVEAFVDMIGKVIV